MEENKDNELKKGQIYTKEYFKGLSGDTRKLVYQAAAILASGYLSFDAGTVAGTGGGPLALAGRLGTLHVAIPWVCSLAMQIAEYIGLEDKELVERKAKAEYKKNNPDSEEMTFVLNTSDLDISDESDGGNTDLGSDSDSEQGGNTDLGSDSGSEQEGNNSDNEAEDNEIPESL